MLKLNTVLIVEAWGLFLYGYFVEQTPFLLASFSWPIVIALLGTSTGLYLVQILIEWMYPSQVDDARLSCIESVGSDNRHPIKSRRKGFLSSRNVDLGSHP